MPSETVTSKYITVEATLCIVCRRAPAPPTTGLCVGCTLERVSRDRDRWAEIARALAACDPFERGPAPTLCALCRAPFVPGVHAPSCPWLLATKLLEANPPVEPMITLAAAQAAVESERALRREAERGRAADRAIVGLVRAGRALLARWTRLTSGEHGPPDDAASQRARDALEAQMRANETALAAALASDAGGNDDA